MFGRSRTMKRSTTPRSLVVRSTWTSSKKPESQSACTSDVSSPTLKACPGFSRRYESTSSRATRRLPTTSIVAMGRPSACSATVGGRRTVGSAGAAGAVGVGVGAGGGGGGGAGWGGGGGGGGGGRGRRRGTGGRSARRRRRGARG